MIRRDLRPHVFITGSREFCRDELSRVEVFIKSLTTDTVLIVGDADGVDKKAFNVAKAQGLAILRFSPPWAKDGKRAGLLRNTWMLDILPPSARIHAFWNGRSTGTADAIRKAERRGYQVEITYDRTAPRENLWEG